MLCIDDSSNMPLQLSTELREMVNEGVLLHPLTAILSWSNNEDPLQSNSVELLCTSVHSAQKLCTSVHRMEKI